MGSIIWFLIFIGVMYFMHGKGGGCCGGGHSRGRNHESSSRRESRADSLHSHSKKIEGQVLREDPICGINIAEDLAIKKNINGTDYYFCSRECLAKFTEKYTRVG